MSEKQDCIDDLVELTEDLREGIADTWIIVRKLIANKNFDLGAVWLLGFVESEFGEQFGLLLVSETCFEFKRVVGTDDSFIYWYEGEENLKVFEGWDKEIRWAFDFIADKGHQ